MDADLLSRFLACFFLCSTVGSLQVMFLYSPPYWPTSKQLKFSQLCRYCAHTLRKEPFRSQKTINHSLPFSQTQGIYSGSYQLPLKLMLLLLHRSDNPGMNILVSFRFGDTDYCFLYREDSESSPDKQVAQRLVPTQKFCIFLTTGCFTCQPAC